MYCERCQSEFPEAKKFCPQCGAHLKMLASPIVNNAACPSCGTTIQLSKNFCLYCGYRISEKPRQCPTCGAAMPVEATFCEECGTEIPTPVKIDQTIYLRTKTGKVTFNQLLEGNTFAAGNQSAQEDVIFLDSVSREEIIKGREDNRSAQEKGRFFDRLRKPILQLSIATSLLLLVAIFSYRLGSQQQDVEDEPIFLLPDSSSPEVPLQSLVVGETKGTALPPPSQKDKPADAKTSNAPQANGKKANVSLVGEPKRAALPPPSQKDKPADAKTSSAPQAKSNKTEAPPVPEQPLIPARLYRVKTPTVLRNKPTQTGKKIVKLQSGIKITVIAIAGDWLKVVSKANPPKPPGYVWKDDATPEG